jgi:hypothetical protein
MWFRMNILYKFSGSRLEVAETLHWLAGTFIVVFMRPSQAGRIIGLAPETFQRPAVEAL